MIAEAGVERVFAILKNLVDPQLVNHSDLTASVWFAGVIR